MGLFAISLKWLTNHKIANAFLPGPGGRLKPQGKPSVTSSADDVLDKPPVAGAADDVLAKPPVVGNVADDILEIKFEIGYEKHLWEVKEIVRKKNKGVVGGHNYKNFKAAFKEKGWDIDDCIIGEPIPHPTVKGVYELHYRLPALTRDLDMIPGEYKKVATPKTVYDPDIITDSEMLKLGEEAMKNGKIVGPGKIEDTQITA